MCWANEAGSEPRFPARPPGGVGDDGGGVIYPPRFAAWVYLRERIDACIVPLKRG
jgi:hypothetical protein